MKPALPLLLLCGLAAAQNFDGTELDFEFIADKPVPVAAGDPIYAGVTIRRIGAFRSSVALTARADAPLQTQVLTSLGCPVVGTCETTGPTVGLAISAPADIPSGIYGIELTGRGGGKEHTVHLTVIVDPVLTDRKKRRAEALEELKREDAEPPEEPGPAVAVRLGSPGEPEPTAKFFAEVDLRKIHAVLVLDRSTSMRQSCEFLKASAIRFSGLFIEGRDSVGIIDYGLSVDTMLPLTDQFRAEARDRISKMRCAGATNTGEALEAAQAELAAHRDPEAINAVILFTDGVPNVLTANWPVRMPSDGCEGWLLRKTCPMPPRICDEGATGQVAGTLMPTYSFDLEPAGLSLADETNGEFAKNRGVNSCFGLTALGNLTYIPDEDLRGVSLSGTHRVQRYEAGIFAGKLRLDSAETIFNAMLNQVANAAGRLRTDPDSPSLVYVVGFQNSSAPDAVKSVTELRGLANDPAAFSFDPKQPAGLAILASAPEDFWPAFLTVRQEVVKQATVH